MVATVVDSKNKPGNRKYKKRILNFILFYTIKEEIIRERGGGDGGDAGGGGYVTLNSN